MDDVELIYIIPEEKHWGWGWIFGGIFGRDWGCEESGFSNRSRSASGRENSSRSDGRDSQSRLNDSRSLKINSRGETSFHMLGRFRWPDETSYTNRTPSILY